MERERTTRERIADRLRAEPLAASALAREFEITTSDALDHVQHVARSLEHEGEQLLVSPPECRSCGFADFDDPINRPSRCPSCKGESVAEPAFRIE